MPLGGTFTRSIGVIGRSVDPCGDCGGYGSTEVDSKPLLHSVIEAEADGGVVAAAVTDVGIGLTEKRTLNAEEGSSWKKFNQQFEKRHSSPSEVPPAIFVAELSVTEARRRNPVFRSRTNSLTWQRSKFHL